MATIYYESDCDPSALSGKTIAVIGYGSQGHAHAQNLRDSGHAVVIGLAEGSKSWATAERDGFDVREVADAARNADVIVILVPDPKHRAVYEKIAPSLGRGRTIVVAHAFSVHFKEIVASPDIDVVLELPESLAAGTNLNAYRQEPWAGGFKVHLGDLVRPKEFVVEVTTPVAVSDDELTIRATATYRNESGDEVQVTAEAAVAICNPDEVEKHSIDEEVVAKVLAQLPTLAEMETMVAFEAGDLDAAGRSIGSARNAIKRVRLTYGASAAIPQMAASEAKLDELNAGTSAGTFSTRDLKRRYGASRRASRGRTADPDDVK